MIVLLTGVAGFIGYHVAKALLARGDTVVAVDNLNAYYDPQLKYARLRDLGIVDSLLEGVYIGSNKYPNLRFIKLDCADQSAMTQLFAYEHFDAVCHLAAQAGVMYGFKKPHNYIHDNITAFVNVLEGCRHHEVKKLVYASSSSVYGASRRDAYAPQDACDHPVSLYAATKKSNELLAHCYSHNFGIAVTGLRFFTVYGPWGRPDMAPMLFLQNILAGKPIKVFNHGDMLRDFTYIDDIVLGCLKVLDATPVANNDWSWRDPKPNASSAPFRVYNIGNGTPIRLMDFIKTLENVTGSQAIKQFEPMRVGEVYATCADMQDMMRDFSYKPYTSLEEGVEHLVAWYHDFYKVSALDMA